MDSLTSLPAIKLHLGITDTSDDALLTQLISQAQSDFESRCRRKLVQTLMVKEKYKGPGGEILYLRSYPVDSVTFVSIDDVTVADYERSGLDGELHRSKGWDKDSVILVSYKAGYVYTSIPGINVYRDLPGDLEYACILWVAGAYNSRGSEHLSEEAIGPLKSKFWAEQPAIKAIVDKYRNIYV